MKTVGELMATLPQRGRVEWIGLRPARGAAVQPVEEVFASVDEGLLGDRFKSRRSSRRQVTLIQAEHLPAIGAFLGREAIDPALLRRNLVISGVNLLALKDRTFRVGEATLHTTGACHPCSKMETTLGPGGYNAMRGHGGLTAEVVESGWIRLGDAVEVVEEEEAPPASPSTGGDT